MTTKILIGKWGDMLHRWRDDRGAAAVVFALVTPVLAGAAGLAVETSYDYLTKVRVQGAADAAAYAAGLQMVAGSTQDAISAAASQQAAANGWSANGGTITVHSPPTAGANAGSTSAVEVRLSQNVPRFFSALFSSTPIVATGRAVVASQTASNACVLALNKTASQALQITGNTQVTLNGCDIMSDSVANDAVNVWGSAQISTDCAISAGGVQNHGGLTVTGCAAPITNAARVPDPFAGLPTPAQGQNRNIPNGNNKNGLTLNPGYYNGGMDLQGQVTLNPGVYYVSGGDFRINAGANVSGSGVMIYLASGAHANFNGNSTVNLSPSSSGAYAGVLFFGDRNGSGSNTFNGNNTSSLTGDIYFPTQQVSYLGNFSGAGGGCTHIIADTVSWSGSTTLSVNCANQGMKNIPARQSVKLVE